MIKNYLDFFPDMYDIQVILNHYEYYLPDL